jgi:DNA-binding LacI/PurR family transcriptional regulator
LTPKDAGDTRSIQEIDFRIEAYVTTIKQVAERAGVSTATVSRVLNGNTPVDAQKKEVVLQAVAELNYRPNLLASNLRNRKTAKIGVIVPDIENPIFSRAIQVFEEIAFNRGFRVLLCNSEDQTEKQRAYLEVLADERVEGILMVPFQSEGSEIAATLDKGIPIVAYDRPVDDPRADAVIQDNFEGARRATELLIEAGHQRIGFISGINELRPGADRLAGYTAAIREHGLTPYVASGEFRINRAKDATMELIAHPDGLTGLVIGNNLMAIGVLRAMRAIGIHAPDDLALVGIGDPWWAELVDPPMTNMAYPVRRMAESAANLLFERIAGTRVQPRSVVFGFEVRIRKSCGTAKTS